MRFLFSVFLLAAFVHTGCNIINPADPIPTFVQVDSFDFINPDPLNTVGSTRQIRSVFVSYEGKNVGTFDLPARIPVLAGQGGSLQLFPGVDNTGQFVTQLQYPYYKIASVDLGASAGNTVKATPQTGYVDAARFVYKEDFENSNDIAAIFGPEFKITTTPSEVLSGGRSGMVLLTETEQEALLTSTTTFFPGKTDNFLEIDYRSTAYLRVGLVAGTGNPQYIVTLIPSPTGNKAYISLQRAIGNFGANAGAFRVVMQSYPEESIRAGYVIMDNLKVVTF